MMGSLHPQGEKVESVFISPCLQGAARCLVSHDQSVIIVDQDIKRLFDRQMCQTQPTAASFVYSVLARRTECEKMKKQAARRTRYDASAFNL